MDPHPQLAFRNSSTQRSEFFNKLKPCCLEIAKALRKSGGRDADPGEAADAANTMVTQTDELYRILTDQIGYDASVLDASMAEYASFPLLTILQHMRSYPARLIENATKCLRVLIQYGWRTSISGENAQRLLILLTTVVTGGRPVAKDGKDPQVFLPEETVAEGYRALAALMKAAGAATIKPGSSESPLVTANVVPVLAHAVSVMLEGVTDSIIPAIQVEALGAIEALYTTVKDLEVLASFLPGTVSALVRVVAQPGAHKTPKRVVVRTLEVLFAVLVNTLGDMQTRRLQRPTHTTAGDEDDEKTVKDDSDDEAEEEIISDTVAASEALPPRGTPAPSISSSTTAVQKKHELDAAWLKATASQIKLALSSVLKLRNHESEDVRDALQQFCVGLLDECHTSLADSTSILVESAIVTSPATKNDDSSSLGTLKEPTSAFHSFGPQTTLQHLAILYPELSDVIKSTAYNWATSLPRAMQASDEGVKQRALRNVQKSVAVVEDLKLDSTVLQASLSAALRDSIATLINASAGSRAAVSEAVSEDAILQLADNKRQVDDETSTDAVQTKGHLATKSMAAYKPVLFGLSSQKDTRDAVLELIANIGPPAQQAQLASEMLDFVRDADGVDQVSAFWLAFELVKAAFTSSEEDPDSFLDLSSFNESAEAEAVFEDLFSFSVSALSAHSDVSSVVAVGDGEADWRVGAIALEVTAYAAARLGEDFRPELIDVLYPIATYLGAPEDRLRAHAVATLNSLAVSCQYDSVSALIVDNVDYMLNSVSLRLNTFDISPASTRVLTMMIRLAGARLVPYLDDVVAAIFAALDNYHGYPLFVENLFAVLSEVVQQSVLPASSNLLLEDGSSKSKKSSGEPASEKNLKRRPEAESTNDLVTILDRRAKRRKELAKETEDDDVEEIGHPKQPWKEGSEADKLLRKHEKKAKKGEEGEDEEEDGEDDGDDGSDGEPTDTNKEGNEVSRPEDPKTPTYALLARITTLTQHYLTAPTPTLRKSLLDLLGTVAPALASADENAFLPLVNAVWPVVVTRLYDGAPYVGIAACEALAALCASAGDFLSTRIKAEWHAKLAGWAARAKAAAVNKVAAKASSSTSSTTLTTPPTPVSSNLLIGGRPSVIHVHQRGSAQPKTNVLVPRQATTGNDELVAASSTPSGLGRFAQAVQVWEAVAGLLIAIVTYVKLDDDVYDAILELLLGTAPGGARVLPVSEERRAREALAVVNPDAVWLARYRAGQLGDGDAEDDSWMFANPPVLAGVSFVSLVG